MSIVLRVQTAARPILRWIGLYVVWLGLIPLGALGQTPQRLPFFDDFSTSAGRPGLDLPNPARWVPGSGVYINNSMGINQPTVGIASFDGLRANGLPYTQNNQLAQGYTDTLASQPINLAGLSVRDSIYLSFYWQSRGLGELPDPPVVDTLRAPGSTTATTPGSFTLIVRQPGDSLTVQFRDAAGNWQTVWFQVGGRVNNNFPQAFVRVSDSKYFHANFAFRFRSFGRESGPFDTWNVDYVYLNRGRSINDRFVKDVAARQAVSPFLKRYTAMPLAQYVVNPAAETADSVITDINNLEDGFNFTTFQFSVRDEVSGRSIQQDPVTPTTLIPSLSSQRKVARPVPVSGFGTATRAQLRYTFNVNTTTDQQNPPIPGVDLRQNDTISGVAVLDNYYAYDDGSWEYGLQVGPREQLAVRFILNKPDVMTGVRLAVVPFKTDQTGQAFVLNVYSNDRGRPGAVIHRKSFTTRYPPYRNAFTEFLFDRGIAVRDTFYVGYQQISTSDTTLFRIGFDKNSPFGNAIFYNGGTIWEQNAGRASQLNFQGALMLRPILGGTDAGPVTAIPEPEPLPVLRTYPNPSTGLIRWDDPDLTRLEVIHPNGRLLLVIEPTRGQHTADLSQLPDGLYVLRLSTNQQTAVQKLMIQH
ncbi:T9SS type A sorting domain-containing protein [Spirosoma montaniterrae]|uniref:Secretion system C-terminal sorting domain-containing protein n=1 Tax=Spirosoma montaniterrae TaxID=1178516 RepID=A0A1P9WY87_9BACT|nr:T9SS type A sorting domain-containing protein [Spirosoma montaniterrae]AQG80339.1 hypothetical protein AWR27_14035 [Spirosoma montaniterrae]